MSTGETDIAIVIPAYKSDFFEEALESVIHQTDKNYHIYIGNDDSKDDKIESIIESFGNLPNLTYKRFENNLGQTSLPLHWNRCLEMVQNEKWIWLFSDDDVMDEDCIRNFRYTQSLDHSIKLFRFNTIKFCDEILLKENKFPDRLSVVDFMKIKLGYIQESYVIEYIFDRALLDVIGKFPDLPLGWCSDDLFWIKAGMHTDIVTIPDALVYWRYSNQNISGMGNTADTAYKKMQSCCSFMHELNDLNIFSLDKDLEICFFNWVMQQFQYLKSYLNKTDEYYFLSDIYKTLKNTYL